MFNQEGECGTGAVVPWAGSLWAVTYGPHCPVGSSDKLYQITPDLKQIVRAESVGGTPANRLVHRALAFHELNRRCLLGRKPEAVYTIFRLQVVGCVERAI